MTHRDWVVTHSLTLSLLASPRWSPRSTTTQSACSMHGKSCASLDPHITGCTHALHRPNLCLKRVGLWVRALRGIDRASRSNPSGPLGGEVHSLPDVEPVGRIVLIWLGDECPVPAETPLRGVLVQHRVVPFSRLVTLYGRSVVPGSKCNRDSKKPRSNKLNNFYAIQFWGCVFTSK
jgi:hypothetical protein